MNLDKHDLFRNTIPGFVFLVVILSFYAVAESLDKIQFHQETLVLAVAGLPLGYIVYHLYRVIFHHLFGEQSEIEREDAEMMSRVLGEDIPREAYSDVKDKNRLVNHVLIFGLSQEAYKNWKSRIDFLFSYVHALGASAFSIILALLFMYWIKRDFLFNIFFIDRAVVLTCIWILVAILFWCARCPIKSAIKVSKRVFLEITKEEMKTSLEKFKRIEII